MLFQFFKNVSKLQGDMAELGVYKGGSAKLLSHLSMRLTPKKIFYLLDTFEGMPETDLKEDLFEKGYLKDTNINSVRRYLADCRNVGFLKGLFSETSKKIDKNFYL